MPFYRRPGRGIVALASGRTGLASEFWLGFPENPGNNVGVAAQFALEKPSTNPGLHGNNCFRPATIYSRIGRVAVIIGLFIPAIACAGGFIRCFDRFLSAQSEKWPRQPDFPRAK